MMAISSNNLNSEDKITANGHVHIVNNNRNEKGYRNFLSPTEVTFCDVDDDDNDDTSIGTASIISKSRRRTLPHLETDADSIESFYKSHNSKEPKIPDGGYGWVVVIASLFVSLISDGISFSFGMLYTEFLSYFQESKAKTAWIGSIFLAVPLISGPIMSNLVDRYGCKRMTIIGGLMSGSGFILASFSNSIESLYWTFGVCGGLGLGIGYVTAVVSIAFWFDKKRTFACGIGASGTGLGTFIYAPLTTWLIQMYGWRGCCIILAGTLLNICVCGALMRDPDWLVENKLDSRSQSIQTFSNSSVCFDEIKKLIETGATTESVLDTLLTNCNTEANQQILDPNKRCNGHKCSSVLLLPTYLEEYENYNGTKHGSWRSLRRKPSESIEVDLMPIKYSDPMHPNQLRIPQTTKAKLASAETLNTCDRHSCNTNINGDGETHSSSSNSTTELTGNGRYLKNILNASRLSLPSIISKPNEDCLPMKGSSLGAINENAENRTEFITIFPNGKKGCDFSVTMPRKQGPRHRKHADGSNLRRNQHLRNSNYLQDMRLHRHSINYRGAMLNTHRYRLKASSCPNIYRNSMTTLAKNNEEKWYDSFVDIIKSIFDFSLFLDAKFAAFNISTLLLFIWYIVPYFYLPEYMISRGYTEDESSKVIAAIGMSNTIGMIVLGWFGDRPNVNIYKIYTVCLILCGISCAMMPFVMHNYTLLMTCGLIYGVTFASNFSFTPIILVHLVDLDEFTCSYGLVLLVQGIGSLIGPPISGVIYELTNEWASAFYAGGFWIALSGVFAYITGYLQDKEKDEADTAADNSNSKSLSSAI